jgi:hypothetical protein
VVPRRREGRRRAPNPTRRRRFLRGSVAIHSGDTRTCTDGCTQTAGVRVADAAPCGLAAVVGSGGVGEPAAEVGELGGQGEVGVGPSAADALPREGEPAGRAGGGQGGDGAILVGRREVEADFGGGEGAGMVTGVEVQPGEAAGGRGGGPAPGGPPG